MFCTLFLHAKTWSRSQYRCKQQAQLKWAVALFCFLLICTQSFPVKVRLRNSTSGSKIKHLMRTATTDQLKKTHRSLDLYPYFVLNPWSTPPKRHFIHTKNLGRSRLSGKANAHIKTQRGIKSMALYPSLSSKAGSKPNKIQFLIILFFDRYSSFPLTALICTPIM